ncbi:MAG: hypothetical protein ACRCX2_01415 [Paraclostridium sp.]
MFQIGEKVNLLRFSRVYKDDIRDSDSVKLCNEVLQLTVTKKNKQSYSMKKEGDKKTYNFKFYIRSTDGKEVIEGYETCAQEELVKYNTQVVAYRVLENCKNDIKSECRLEYYEDNEAKLRRELGIIQEKLDFVLKNKEDCKKRSNSGKTRLDTVWESVLKTV